MLPLQQAYEVKEAIREYIKATFRFKDQDTNDAFYGFIEDKEHGMMKGPYVSLRAPFKQATDEEIMSTSLDIMPPFRPFRHQIRAFQRLASKDGQPRNTLLTTGTGSGKTECFLYPILDYCYHNRDRRGIKVIIMYPMNALATDQAKRIAKTINNDKRLHGLTAGLFIGVGKDKDGELCRTMTENHVIEDRETIIQTQPDILLTNFKMLDMGLMQGYFAPLWQYNLKDPTLLQYLVLDELHTYDGAQGTDVANLVRRLKLRLNIPQGQLCGVGTSATLGTGLEALQDLCNYASAIYGETFDKESIIGEERVDVDTVFAEEEIDVMPSISDLYEHRVETLTDYDIYIGGQMKIWHCESTDALELSRKLSKIQFIKDLVRVTAERGILSVDTLIVELAKRNSLFNQLPELVYGTFSPRKEALCSICALISEAKVKNGSKLVPLLTLQVQLWVRELSGIRRIFDEKPRFTWDDEIDNGRRTIIALPAYFCRDCGASGWLAMKSDNEERFHSDISEVNRLYMQNGKNVYCLNTATDTHDPNGDYEPTNVRKLWVNKHTLQITDDNDEAAIQVWASRKVVRDRLVKVCPECGTEGRNINILGHKTATLASIAISQMLSTDLDKEDARGRKVLAFTNSVQDASHEARFFESRNYNFTFRQSLQEVIKQENGPVSLSKLENDFVKHWKSKGTVEDYVYRFFPPDYDGKVDIRNDYRNHNGSFEKSFLEEFDTRMRWNVVAEFGINATVGRTLEKVGSAATFFHYEDVEKVWNGMQVFMKDNGFGIIAGEEHKQDFMTFINAILHRMRIHGSVNHEYLDCYRGRRLDTYELNWIKNPIHFLNRNFGRGSKFPKLVMTTSCKSKDLQKSSFIDSAYSKGGSSRPWFHNYFIKTFIGFGVPNDVRMLNDLFYALFQVMETTGLVLKARNNQGENYVINPDKIYISKNVKHIRCNECRSLMCLTKEDNMSENAHCINNRCSGTYSQEEPLEMDYYRNVYDRRYSSRVYSHEHTGMLDRRVREAVEADFKKRKNLNSINTLVATSTLEMGIDIGDLNMAINTAVPPQPMNFLQRVGRAGRKSGTALIVDFAKNEAHDLYYFKQPIDMMNGLVHTPGCYLTAKDMLARHFFAFCIDTWTSLDPIGNRIPPKIINLKLNQDFTLQPEFFMNRISMFIKSDLDKLEDRFASQYDDKVKTTALEQLYKEHRLSSYEESMLLPFRKLRTRFLNMSKQCIDTYKNIKQSRLADNDPELAEMKIQLGMLHRQVRAMCDKSMLEFMTDEGLLPNYAFPETGVKLNVSVLGRSPKGEEHQTVSKPDEFEFVRPASQAIKELAPGNFFYAKKYRLPVDGINTYDWTDKDTLLLKRFCSRCDYIEDETSIHSTRCPKCGDPSFGASSNVAQFVKLNAVKSNVWRDKAVTEDVKDDRDKNNYRVSTHFIFDKTASIVSYGMKEIPFGIEFVKGVTLTELNLGDSEAVGSSGININGLKHIPQHGFITCKYCGKSTSILSANSEDDGNKYEWHYKYCNHRDYAYTGVQDDIFQHVFLYRKIHTEAIKILLPVQEIDTEAQVAMFKAGIALGLREYFKGNPDHLRLQEYREYNTATDKFDQYVILYDTIPGGTGYLEKLSDPKEFTELLKIAYDKIRYCDCQKEGKDGCYRCIFTYGNQFIRKELSRAKAEILFGKIIDKSDEWETINASLGTINGDGGLEQSELETRFINLLSKTTNPFLDEDIKGIPVGVSMKFNTILANGLREYTLIFETNSTRIGYNIIPQRPLGKMDGVRYQTTPDFFFICSLYQRKEDDGRFIDDDPQKIKRIAVYLDGYTYHARPNEQGEIHFPNDLKKREGIKSSGNILTWTLTWHDLDLFDGTSDNIDGIETNGNAYHREIEKMMKLMKSKFSWTESKNSLSRLLYVLAYADDMQTLERATCAFFAGCVRQKSLKEHINVKENLEHFGITESPLSQEAMKIGDFYVSPDMVAVSGIAKLYVAVYMKDAKLVYDIAVKCNGANALDQNEWEYFWQLYNLLQLCPNELARLESNGTEIDQDLLENFDEALWPIVRLFYENGIDFNKDDDFCLRDDDDEVLADAQLGSDQLKIVIAPYSDEARNLFIKQGYEIYTAEDVEQIKNKIKL